MEIYVWVRSTQLAETATVLKLHVLPQPSPIMPKARPKFKKQNRQTVVNLLRPFEPCDSRFSNHDAQLSSPPSPLLDCERLGAISCKPQKGYTGRQGATK